MILEGPLGQVEKATAALDKAVSSAEGWADDQRQAFDRGRVQPLKDAGTRLMTALQRAQDQLARAERLLSEG